MAPIDSLDNRAIKEINQGYPWRTYITDGRGRRIGDPAGRYHAIPSDHTLQCDQKLTLSGKSVLEFGCHEGTHTVTLTERAASVLAIDARTENIEKTRVRCGIFGLNPQLRVMDVDQETPPQADLYFHVGVLYHLKDPVRHLALMGRAKCIYLDTHYVKTATGLYKSSDGLKYPCVAVQEDPSKCQSGMSSFARWLDKDLLVELVRAQFHKVEILSTRLERYGPRITLIGRR